MPPAPPKPPSPPGSAPHRGRLPYDPWPRRPPSAAEPVTVNLRRAPADVEIPWHSHDWAQLAYPLSGTIRLATADTAWIVPPLRAIWIPPRIAHTVVMLGAVELRTLYVDPASSPLPLDHCRVVEVSDLMRALSEVLAASPGPQEPRRSLMSRLLVEEMGSARPLSLGLPLPRDRRLMALCQALLDQPASSLGLEEWATRVGASSRTLARLFHKELGMPFGAWRQQLRLSRAAALVAQGHSLGAVAAELGYASPSAFSAMFKRTFGQSPRQFFHQ